MAKVAAATLAALVLTAAIEAPDQRRCNAVGPRPVGELRPLGARRLDLLPPAQHVLTVFRTVDGCLAPVIVRSSIGVDRSPAPPR
ncbi:hypothetical protein [Sandarakinorhabdus sp. DWP1-3-1]|uniref:hypothetical protein n=1 Tax=Sandarakinorhabdus sp. DWP1-3-1 TaxID=2804627 RepID=UPI003CE9EBAF